MARTSTLRRRRAVAGTVAVALVSTMLVLLPGEVGFAAAGDLDASFSGDGSTATGLPDAANAVALQGDGKIVSVGTATGSLGYKQFAVSRHNANGSLDTTFGTGGLTQVQLDGTDDHAHAVAIQPDGKILVAGESGGDMGIIRLDSNGSLDPSFGGPSPGVAVLQSSPDPMPISVARSMALLGDGRIVLGGFARSGGTGSPSDFKVVRLLPNGSFDTTFGGGDGVAIADVGGSPLDLADINDIAVDGLGRVVAVGHRSPNADPATKDWAIARFLDTGALDTGFSGDGIVVTSPSGLPGDDIAYGVAVQPDGKVVVAGEGAPNAADRPLPQVPIQILRFLDSGNLDPSFGGGDGRTGAGVLGNFYVRDVALQSNGAIVLASSVEFEDNNGGHFDRQVMIERFASDGSGLSGSITNFTAGDEIVNAVAIQPDGKIVGAGGGDPGPLLFRLLGDPVAPPPMPAMGRITFSKTSGGDTDVWVVADNGTSPVNLTPGTPSSDSDSTFSPDGTRIAFVSNRRPGADGDRDVYFMNANGTNIQMVPNSTIWDADPEWSPNGEKIVFARDMGGQNFDLWVYDTTLGSSETNPFHLTTNTARAEGFPSWSPDGSTIAYRSVVRGSSTEDIFTIPADGGAETPLIAGPSVETSPSWSPDGTRLAYASGASGAGDIYIANADGTGQLRVTTSALAEGQPDWSPDGNRIVFRRVGASGQGSLVTTDVDGSNELTIVSTGDNGGPSWVGDGLLLTVDQPVIPASPSSVPLNRIALSPNAPAPGPDGLPPLLDASIAGLPPLLDASIAGLPLLDASIAGLPPILDASIAGLPPLLDASIAGLPPLLDASIAGLPPLLDASIAGLPLLDASIAGLPDIPAPGGWEGILALGSPYANQPLENISLRQVLALLPANGQQPTYDAQRYIAALCLCDIDWASATNPLRTVGAVPLALTRTTFRMMTLLANDVGWCKRFEDAGFPSCGSAFGGLDGTALGYQAGGGDLTKLPLNSLPMGSINIANSALIDYRLDNIDAGIDLDNTPLGSILISEIPAATRDAVVNCTTPSSLRCDLDNLATAGDLGMLRTGANPGRIRHLGTFPSPGVFAPIARLAGFGLGEVVFTLLPTPPIEELSYEALRLQYYGGPTSSTLDYHLTYNYTGEAPSVAGVIAQVTLPPSFAPVRGSSRLTLTGGAQQRTSEPLADPSVSGGSFTWNLPAETVTLDQGTRLQIDFQVRPGIETGTFTGTAELAGPGLQEAVGGQAEVVVVENHESPAFQFNPESEVAFPAPPVVAADTAVLTHLDGDDVDTFRYPVPIDPQDDSKVLAGARIEVYASHFTNDNDLVVYLPAGTSNAEPPRLSSPSITLRGEPVVAPPHAPVPVADTLGGLETGTVKAAEQTVNDVPLRTDLEVGAISASHGLYDERVEVEVPAGAVPGDHFTIEIRSYNLSGSATPAMFRVREIAPMRLPACAPRTRHAQSTLPPELTLPRTTAIRPTGTATELGGPTETLILFSAKRMFDSYGLQSTIDLKSEVTNPAFLAMPEVKGQVVNLDAEPLFTQASADADGDPCSLEKSNKVVSAINAVIDSHLVSGLDYQLRSVVIVGTDEVIPHQRVIDYTRKFNERLYRADLDFTTKDGTNAPKNNALLNAAARGYVVSDAAYGDLAPYVFDGGFVNVPQLAVGRIVESSTQAADAFRRFRQFNGRLDPSSALSAGYDFVNDNAQRVNEGFAANGVPDRKLLVGETWTASDYVNGLKATDPAAGARSLINTNGHYNHFLMQPAAGSQLFSTGPLPNQSLNLKDSVGSLAGRGILTMSCHTALNVSDLLLGAPTDGQKAKLADWPQAYDFKGAAFLVGSSGYGYGDKYTLGYGERLITSFASALKPGASVGQAFIDAQQEYFSSLGVNGVYDNKVLQENMMFGFPMYLIGGASAATMAAAAAPAAVTPTPVADIPGLSKATITHTPALATQTQPDGTALLTDGGQLPQLTQDQPITAKALKDISATNMTAAGALVTSYRYKAVTGFKNSISRPAADNSAMEPTLRPDDALFPVNLNRIGTKSGTQGTTQSLVVHSTRFAAGGTSGGHTVGTLHKHGVSTHDVLYVADPAQISGQRPAPIRSFTSAVTGTTLSVDLRIGPDASGVPVKKVLVLYAEVKPGQEVVSKQLWLTQDSSDSLHWTGTATVSTPAVELFAQALKANGLVSLSLNKRASTGNAAPPVITITSPIAKVYGVNEVIRAAYTCLDPQTGKPTPMCEGTVPSGGVIDTSTPGTRTFQVTATSAGSVVAVEEVTYTVGYGFAGFFSPIKNKPTRNIQKAGSTVPVKWRLTNVDGTSFAGLQSKDVTLVFRQVPCSPGQQTWLLPLTVALPSALVYDPVAQQYNVNVKTPVAFKGSCQEMEITFYGDQTSMRTADFEFK